MSPANGARIREAVDQRGKCTGTETRGSLEKKRDTGSSLEAPRASETVLQHIAENALDLIAEVDAEGRFLFVSANYAALSGIPQAELLGVRLTDPALLERIHPDDRERILCLLGPRESAPEPFVYRFRAPDGGWRWYETLWRRFRTAEGEGRAVVVSRDVTDREEALRKLRFSERRYRSLSEATFDLVAEVDAEGRVVFVSPSFEYVLGYRVEELVGTTPFSLMLHPDDIESLADAFLTRVRATHRPTQQRTFRVRHRNGSWRWLQGHGINFETLDGEIHVVAVMRDVTELLRAADERSKLEEWMQQSQKLESLGIMAAGVAHDFNNLLTPILGDASLALMDLPPDSPVRERLERIQRAANHAAGLTKQLLDYAGIGSVDTEPVDLAKLVSEMGELLQSSAPQGTRLDYELAADLPAVRADPGLVSQVFLNLLTNAFEAAESGPGSPGRVVVRAGSLEADRGRLSKLILGEDLVEGPYAYFEVHDDGAGIDAETRARIFDPFFTTKFTGRGLGLAAVLGIVRKHRGAIEIESEPGAGTRVRVLWPEAGCDAASPPHDDDAAPPRSPGTVLVADDDEGAREIMCETLSRAGLEVMRAGDGAEAVSRFRDHADRIGLVLLDRTMPGTSGEEALDEIRRIRPDVPVLLVSGYSRERAIAGITDEPGCGFLQKPFLPETLVEKVAELLSA